MNEDNERVIAFLLEQSDMGVRCLLQSAEHFLITRLSRQHFQGTLTEAIFSQLIEEAWSVFVLPNIMAYHTWAVEPDVNQADDEEFDVYLANVKASWITWLGQARSDYFNSFV